MLFIIRRKVSIYGSYEFYSGNIFLYFRHHSFFQVWKLHFIQNWKSFVKSFILIASDAVLYLNFSDYFVSQGIKMKTFEIYPFDPVSITSSRTSSGISITPSSPPCNILRLGTFLYLWHFLCRTFHIYLYSINVKTILNRSVQLKILHCK